MDHNDVNLYIQMDESIKHYKDTEMESALCQEKKVPVRTPLHCFKCTASSQHPLEGRDRVMTNTEVLQKVTKGTKNDKVRLKKKYVNAY